MTWEEAKATTKAKTLDIVALIPSGDIVTVDQREKGSLFNCDKTRHTWTGTTDVTLTLDADTEAILKKVEPQLKSILRDRGDFTVTNRIDAFGDYAVTAESSTTAESYLLSLSQPGVISISSWSECFTLPEGVYPGGLF